MKPSVYIEREGRQFGIEDRVRVVSEDGGKRVVLYEPKTTLFLTLPALRARLWALLHGYGWLPVR